MTFKKTFSLAFGIGLISLAPLSFNENNAKAGELEMASLSTNLHYETNLKEKPEAPAEPKVIHTKLVNAIVPNMLDSDAFTEEDWQKPRELDIYRPVFNRSVKVVYWKDGKYLPEGLKQLNRIMRDTYNGHTVQMDKRLFDALWAAQTLAKRYGNEGTIEVTSGYRSPSTNKRIRKIGYKAAKHSLHMSGKAIDFRIRGLKIKTLGKLMRSFNMGGVGTYKRHRGNGWVHVDTGDIRQWRG